MGSTGWHSWAWVSLVDQTCRYSNIKQEVTRLALSTIYLLKRGFIDVYRRSGAGSTEEESRVLLLCLRGIAAFCLAASRRSLGRVLLVYFQSAANPTWHSVLIASLTGASGPRGVTVPTCEAPGSS
jgi:hypothetical protein